MASSNQIASTKNKFGVPLSTATGTGILMPKLKHRFRVSMLAPFAGSQNTNTFTQNVVSVGRPTVQHDEIQVHSYNSRVYIQGKHEWQTIDLTVRDDITNSVSRLVGAQETRQVNHFQQTSPIAGEDYKFDMQIEVLDGQTTEATEVWFLEGCMFSSVNYGDHDYTSAEPSTIAVTVRYDNALHFAGDNDLNGRIEAGNMFEDIANIGNSVTA